MDVVVSAVSSSKILSIKITYDYYSRLKDLFESTAQVYYLDIAMLIKVHKWKVEMLCWMLVKVHGVKPILVCLWQ